MAIVICSECGARVSDKATVCAQCGAPISVSVIDEFGMLYIEWEGKWVVMDTSVDLFINGQLVGKYSFKEGFSVDIPILSRETEVTIKSVFRTVKHTFTFEPHQNYSCSLVYSRFTGGFGFEVTGEGGYVISDRLSFIMGLLCYLFPILGFGYAFYVKKDKPAIFPTAMIVAAAGFFLGFFFLMIYDLPFFIALSASFVVGGLSGVISVLQGLSVL